MKSFGRIVSIAGTAAMLCFATTAGAAGHRGVHVGIVGSGTAKHGSGVGIVGSGVGIVGSGVGIVGSGSGKHGSEVGIVGSGAPRG